ncbi:MAG: glycerophosphodiester phosphodiesterase family protein [Candidatus Thermoplasmatota archaeon]|nr:glycerophosphodiester phosphodiesterase family protein [Candidatus Thermoplasmatota archaeon]
MKNSGHRLGTSGSRTENTIEGLQSSLDHVSRSDFRYWEFDIQESSDGKVFVFHDDEIFVDGSPSSTSEMTFTQIQEAGLQQGFSIPLFSEVCEHLRDREEPVMVEIKHLETDQARSEVLETISKMSKWKAMATPIRFSSSFPEETRDEWRSRFESEGVELVRVGRHRLNLFRSCKTRMGWFFAQPRWLFGL